ncbi:NADH-quinone oxidoreductase subunit C [Pseudonocardia endophytica]|uniref:Ni,Fe-hydrogenase III large subunit n=1 Tax=Pseudonocardia endophytica TaxID=401976 RepID=A0A4R1I2J1_PSEEN|nr:NADH-quinone oxidoreductase subunit C [Pseudonocardia endophytica]TCK27835.1 Ni,Fe-hydrogenase III large subunit [Pseudonocardia endophytica]
MTTGTTTAHRTAYDVTHGELERRAVALLDDGFRLALLAGHDDGAGHLRAVYLFTAARPDRRVELHLHLGPDRRRVPSLAAHSFPAGRFEREMRDLFGIVPVDHPLPRRLVRHFHWPRGWYPMLGDAGPPPAFGQADGPYPFRAVEGPGVYEIPVGPVHAGMIEPGHFRFSVVGETILNLKARLWFVHRGVEKLFEGRTADRGVELAERVSGDTSVGHALAYCQAVEDATGTAPGAHGARLRAVLLELERLYNHATDIGALCNDVGLAVLNNHAQRIREQFLRINDEVAGHRLLRGAVAPGSVRVRRLPDPARVRALGADLAEVADLALGNSVVRDRFAGTAVLTPEQAHDLGTLGYVARASGLDVDARTDHPVSGVPAPPSVPAPEGTRGGDVLARFVTRVREVQEAAALIEVLVREVDGRLLARADPDRAATPTAGSGVGIVEGWRGTVVHRVEVGPDGTLRRVKIVDPSFLNWPALPVALAGTIVPDFPLTNKSFNLSYAGNDL